MNTGGYGMGVVWQGLGVWQGAGCLDRMVPSPNQCSQSECLAQNDETDCDEMDRAPRIVYLRVGTLRH